MLTSNGVPLPGGSLGPLRELEGRGASTLRAQYARDGYLLFRGLLPRRRVDQVRAAYLGSFAGQAERRHGFPGHPAYDFVRTDDFRAFADSPTLHAVADMVLGGPSRRLRRVPFRHFRRGHVASRAHVDLDYLSEGSDRVLTAWVPVGDCRISQGSLVYLEGSHGENAVALRKLVDHRTDRPHDARHITNDLALLSERTGRPWLTSDFGAGDVVLHDPRIVHASLDCDDDEDRVSMDVRFALPGWDDPRWDDDWAGNDSF